MSIRSSNCANHAFRAVIPFSAPHAEISNSHAACGDCSLHYPRDEDSTAKPQGYVARRWDPAVRERFQKLLAALGREFDGQIEGINLPETSVEFGTTGARHVEQLIARVVAGCEAIRKPSLRNTIGSP